MIDKLVFYNLFNIFINFNVEFRVNESFYFYKVC